MPNEPRLQTRDLPLTCAEPVYRDVQESSPRGVTVASMTTSTFTLASQSITTTGHTGYYAIPADGNARGQLRQIKSITGLTATVDQPWSSTTSVTAIRLWQPPDIPVVGSSAGTTGTIVSSAHANLTNEPDDWPNSKGYFLLGRNSTFALKCYTESDFATSTGTFTVSPVMDATPGIGAFFDLRHLVRAEGPVNATVNQKVIERRIVGFQSADAAAPITYEGTVDFVLPVRPVSTAAIDGVTAVPPLDIRDYLTDLFTETLNVGDRTSTNASGDTIFAVSSTTATGSFVLLNNGEACQLIANNGAANLTVGSGQMTASTVNPSGSNIIGSSHYVPKTSDFRTRTFDIYRARLVRQLFHGCMPTMEISVTRDQLITFALKYVAATALEYETTNPITSTTFPLTLIDTSIPTDGKGARFLINGTKCLVSDLKVNPGFTPLPRMCLSGVNQTDGMAMDVGPAKGSFTAYADINDVSGFKALAERLHNGDVVQLLYQKGNSPKETFCMGMPSAQLTKVVHVYNGGQGEIQCEFTCQVPTLSGLGSSVPAFSIGWM